MDRYQRHYARLIEIIYSIEKQKLDFKKNRLEENKSLLEENLLKMKENLIYTKLLELLKNRYTVERY